MSGSLRSSGSGHSPSPVGQHHKARKPSSDDVKLFDLNDSNSAGQSTSQYSSRQVLPSSPPKPSAHQVIDTLESHLSEAFKALENHPNAPEHCLHITNLLLTWTEKFRTVATTFSDSPDYKSNRTPKKGIDDAGTSPSEPRSQPSTNSSPKSPTSVESYSWAATVKSSSPSSISVPSRIAAKLTSRHSERPQTPKKTPEQIHEKLMRAEESRLSNLTSKVKKARESVERVRSVNERMTQIEQTKQQHRQSLIALSQKKADERREQQMQQKKTRAENELQKVKENRSSSKASETPAKRKQEMEERLQEAENRRRAQEEEKRRISQELANPRAITQEERFKRICKHCNAEIRSSEPITTHLISKRHLLALKALGINLDPTSESMPIMAENCVIKVPLFPVVHSPPTDEELAETKQRQESGKRRAKKIKQKLAALAAQHAAQHAAQTAPAVSSGQSQPTKSSQNSSSAQMQRLISDMKDQLTKRHVSLLESSLQKLHKLVLTRPATSNTTQTASATIDGVILALEEAKGVPTLVSIFTTFTPQSGLGNAVQIALQILLMLLKDERFKQKFLLSNQVVHLVNLVMTAEKDEPFLVLALKAIAVSLRWPRSGVSNIEDKTFADNVWTAMFLHIQYVLAHSLLERVRWLFSQQEMVRSSNVKEFGLFIETVRLISNVTAFVRIESDRIRQADLPEAPTHASSERQARLDQLTAELTQCLKETHFVGVLSQLASVLLQEGPLRQSKKRPLSRDLHFLAFCIVELLKSIAIFNIPVIQAFLGTASYEQVEFYHVANFLLTHLGAEELSDSDSSTDGGSHSSSKKVGQANVAVRGNADNKIEARPSDLLHAVVELIGLVSVQNPANQVIALWGQSPNILQRLLSLPFSYFSMRQQRFVLFPTLIALCYENKRNLAVLQQEVSQDMLIEFLDDLLLGRAEAVDISAVSRRLPKQIWQPARDFFANADASQASSDSEQSAEPVTETHG